jgi:serine/threonine protein kinase
MSQKYCFNCGKTILFDAQFCNFCGQGQPQTTQTLTGRLPAKFMLDNRYIIESLIGQGGMGAVYRAIDTRIVGRVCAIKEMSVLSLPDHERPEAVQNFQQEAQLLATLKHPNLPQVHDFFQDGTSGRHYLVMDFVQGATLEELLLQQGRPFTEQQVRTWGWQLCDVLHYLHNQSPPVIFRDLKPQNIMLDQNGQLKLIDFGIARFFKVAKSKDTRAIGTIGYAPPEQHGRGQTDPRSDVYSLGATLWRLLTAQDPADDPYRLPGVRRYNTAVSAELEAVIQRAMQLRPEDRFQSALEFRDALQPQVGLPPPPPPPIRLMLFVILLLLAGGGIGWVVLNNPEPTSTPLPPTSASTVIARVTSSATPAPTENGGVTSSPPSLPTSEKDTLTPTPSHTPSATPTFTQTPTPDTGLPPSLMGVDGVEMVLVPAGDFIMGSTSDDVDTAVALCSQSGNRCSRSDFTNEMPQRTVYLSDFYIDVTEITNDQYRACVNAGVCAAPSDSGAPDARYSVNNYYNRSQYGDYPVVRIRWEDARTYCQWAGEQLPTEAQWEKAARGTDGRIFPWGNNFNNNRANTEEGGGDSLKPVGSYPDGRSPYGVYDMAGSVWEYVADWYSDTYYQNASNTDPTGPSSGADHVLRGGSYSDFKEFARVTNRGTPHSGSIRSGFRGFRCAEPVN